MSAFKALLKQLQSLSKKKGQVQGASTRMTERQREELIELRRMAEKEMEASGQSDDVYMNEYIENLDELLRMATVSSSSTMEETQETARSFLV